MNSGKTHAFFSWAAENATVPDYEYPLHPRQPAEVEQGEDGEEDRRLLELSVPLDRPVWRGEKQPQYVVKADEDSFLMLGELERRLRVAPRRMAYWGCEYSKCVCGHWLTYHQTSFETCSWLVNATRCRSTSCNILRNPLLFVPLCEARKTSLWRGG